MEHYAVEKRVKSMKDEYQNIKRRSKKVEQRYLRPSD